MSILLSLPRYFNLCPQVRAIQVTVHLQTFMCAQRRTIGHAYTHTDLYEDKLTHFPTHQQFVACDITLCVKAVLALGCSFVNFPL